MRNFGIVSVNLGFVKRIGLDLKAAIGTFCFQKEYWSMADFRIQAVMAQARDVFNTGLPILIRETTEEGVRENAMLNCICFRSRMTPERWFR